MAKSLKTAGGKIAALVLAGSIFGLLSGSSSLSAEGPQHVADFQLSDQHYIGRRLYKMDDDKAVVLISYAAGDAAFRADAPALRALKAAYADKGVDFLIIDPRLG